MSRITPAIVIAGIVLCARLAPMAMAGLPAAVSIHPTGDAFVRELAPTLNYGGAGLLCVGGADSVNGDGETNGRFDAVIQFDASEATSVFDSAYGPGRWVMTRIEVRLFENAAPGNPLFPRGVGEFAIEWMSADGWTQGSGTPMNPSPGVGTIMTWSLLQSLLASGDEAEIGSFSSGGGGPLICPLPLLGPPAADFAAGGAFSLHLSPITSTIGFSFQSTNYLDSSLRPTLVVVAVPRGDADCNGLITPDDIGAFVSALLSGVPVGACPEAVMDMNQDGRLDGGDVQGFVERFLQG